LAKDKDAGYRCIIELRTIADAKSTWQQIVVVPDDVRCTMATQETHRQRTVWTEQLKQRRVSGCLAVALLLPALGAAAANDYAGADACRKCHAAEYEGQSRSAYAHALAPSTRDQPGDWAFGAGTQAITFVRRVNRETYLEHGESWFRSLDGYARTPGHRGSGGIQSRLFDPEARFLRCFACHSTGPVTLGPEDQVIPH
jgi:hypothetical protein